ncbi:hypothetical protein HD553DRAFT_313086 [Filobasidium floriforme]|uniref:uncharacterized protein n=1 Tax=Filobasidium floriforme TaxID=5210 RepID=UPI001E8DF86C|nr:uncharacterized protein HD553DRAFT_313086 [Filobasidium floriforme]KAH8083006.1 hypothetical protein HD553DRAFT_313086 [Filobasidium floriforme]
MSSRGRNPSRPSNTGFKVVPAHAPHSAYLGKAKKLKESLIERARIKRSFAKALKKEGLQSERLGRGQVSGLGQGYGGNGSARGSSFNSRGRGSGRGGGNVGGRPGGRGASRSSVIKSDGVRELVQLSRKTKSNGDSSTAATAAGLTATKPLSKRTVVPESESDESELESGEERAPRPSKTRGTGAGSNLAPNENDDEEDDGFFNDDVEGDMIDSRVSLRRNKGKGKGRADRVDQDGAMSMSEDEDEGNNVKRSRERSRAGPPPGDDDQDEDDEEVFLPYTHSNSNPNLRGRGGSTRGTSTSISTSSRGHNHPQGHGATASSSSSTSTPVYGAGRPRPWGTDGVASMSHHGSGSMGTVTRPKGKKDKGNPNFTFLGRMGDDAGNADRGERDARAGGRTGTKDRMEQEVPPKAVVVNNTPFRGKPLHSHKPPGSTPSSTHPNSTTTTTDNNTPRSTLTLRDLKRTAYLGPAKTSSSASSAFGAVHPGRTKRTLQKQQQQQHAQAQQPGGRAGGGRRNGTGGGGGGSARQPRLGARMGALLQEIERRG